MTILDAMHDPALFGPWFKDRESWRPWEVALAAIFGLPIGEDGARLFRQCTGRTIAPGTPAKEAWFVVGRRGGKSRIAALIALYLACFRDYSDKLAPGEVGTLPVIAADRRQARTVMKYIVGFLDAVPMLKAMVVNITKEAIELTNRVTIEVHTASFRSVRGYSLIGVVCDEIAFWQSDEGSANPDTEILNGLRPGMATLPGAMLIAISSPYARRGGLWDAHRKHFAQDGDGVLVWQAPTATMNPRVDAGVIADAYADDEAAAAAEYGAEFRRDIESFVSREAVEAVVMLGRRELPPRPGIEYVAFVDPSGGSQDSMTLAIAHQEGDHVVLDCVRECRPPFSPHEVVAEFAAVLRSYRCYTVSGDRYGGEWPREKFAEHDISYRTAEKTRSELYLELLAVVNSRRVELLDQPRLIGQLCTLERRTARGGRDSVDHPPHGHDDLINAAAGALVMANAPATVQFLYLDDTPSAAPVNSVGPILRETFPHVFRDDPDSTYKPTCGVCIHWSSEKRVSDGGTGRCRLRLFGVDAKTDACDLFERVGEDD